MKQIIRSNIITESKILQAYLIIDDGKIKDISHKKPEGKIIDLSDFYIVPGFIDLHIHGIHRALADNGAKDLKEICKTLPKYGVTGFLPTLTPRPKGEDAKFLSELTKTETEGTEILGFHLEGPFLAITGAVGAGAITGADEERMNALKDAAKPYKAIFSVSPDVKGIENLIPKMAENNTPVFMTHTAANVEETQRAIELGVRHATHFYDVYPCPAETEPGVRPCGVVEAVLADERVSVDFILDGVHVDPVAVKMSMVSKRSGSGKVCLITDANVGAGLEPGQFSFGNLGDIHFAYKGAPARYVRDDSLAGSGLTMDQALKNAVKFLDLDLVEASKLVSYNPAKVLGLEHKKGLLKKGYDADFVVLNKELDILQTWIKGKRFFERRIA